MGQKPTSQRAECCFFDVKWKILQNFTCESSWRSFGNGTIVKTKLIKFCEVKAGDLVVISYDAHWEAEDITLLVVKTETKGISLTLHGFVVGSHQPFLMEYLTVLCARKFVNQ
jgi:hypothetical protein